VSSVDLIRAARQYLAQWPDGGTDPAFALARMARVSARPDVAFCREVADYFERQPARVWSEELAEQYARFQAEGLRQYETLVASGIRVEPWQGPGAPYQGSRHLVESVLRTGVLFVLLTSDHHGPGTTSPAPPDGQWAHPMRAPSGVRASGVELCHNDIFRAVHDAFGHAMFGHSMGLIGEFRATYCHLEMYSAPAHPVLFIEQVSQICWYFSGPHLRTPTGTLPARGEPGWVPPAERPYPEQKVFPCPPELLARFRATFHQPEGAEAR
jgi:hypothetical protein